MTQFAGRSVHLMDPENTALLIIDVQEKLLPKIPHSDRLVWNITRLIDAAKLLGVKTLATEQYPNGLGATHPQLASRLATPPSKSMFSCRECASLFEPLDAEGIQHILIAGIETHVCVQQTCLDLMAMSFNVMLAVDAIAARFELDHAVALTRMQACGASITTVESALFEWCQTASNPHFKAISALIKTGQTPIPTPAESGS